MNIEQFRVLLDAYGGNADRWPQNERSTARALVESSEEARRLVHDATALDRLLDAAETLPTTRALEERILAAFPERPRKRWPRALAENWIPGAAMACSLALGLLVGTALPGLAGISEASADPALVALGGFGTDPPAALGEGS
jgi:hypothetical protein